MEAGLISLHIHRPGLATPILTISNCNRRVVFEGWFSRGWSKVVGTLDSKYTVHDFMILCSK